jgi:hypothetical protein
MHYLKIEQTEIDFLNKILNAVLQPGLKFPTEIKFSAGVAKSPG